MELHERLYHYYFIEGIRIKDCMKLLDIGEKRFYKIMAEHGWETRRSNISRKKENYYTNKGWMYEQYIVLGKSCRQIAIELDVGETTINNWLGKHDIEARTKSEIHSGKTVSKESRKKMSDARIGRFTGPENVNWKGGSRNYPSTRNHKLVKYRRWCLRVLEKDNYRCVVCGSEEKLHCHHIILMSVSFDNAFNVNNGIVLCKQCHDLAHTRRVVSRESTKLVPT